MLRLKCSSQAQQCIEPATYFVGGIESLSSLPAYLDTYGKRVEYSYSIRPLENHSQANYTEQCQLEGRRVERPNGDCDCHIFDAICRRWCILRRIEPHSWKVAISLPIYNTYISPFSAKFHELELKFSPPQSFCSIHLCLFLNGMRHQECRCKRYTTFSKWCTPLVTGETCNLNHMATCQVTAIFFV